MAHLYSACVLVHTATAVLNKESVFKCMTINKCEDATFLIDLKNEFRFPNSNSNASCFVLVGKLRCFCVFYFTLVSIYCLS